MIHRALVGCAVAASAAVVLTAAPGLAQSRSTDDGTGDVWTQTSGGAQQAGARDNVDLVSTRMSLTAKKLTATATYDDLVRNTDTVEYAVLLKGPDGKEYWAFFFATPDDRNGALRIVKDAGQHKVRCDGKTKSISWADNEISVSIPRSCLGKPRWVKYESAALAYDDAGNAFIDDATSDQAEPSTWSAKLHKG